MTCLGAHRKKTTVTQLVQVKLEAHVSGSSPTELPPTYLVDAELHNPDKDLWHAEVSDFKGNWGQPVQYGMVLKLPRHMNAHTTGKGYASRLAFTLGDGQDDDLEALIKAFDSQVGRRRLERKPSLTLVFAQGDQKLYLSCCFCNTLKWSWAGCGRTPQAAYQYAATHLNNHESCEQATTYGFRPGRIDAVDFTLNPGGLIASLTNVAEVIFPIAPRW